MCPQKAEQHLEAAQATVDGGTKFSASLLRSEFKAVVDPAGITTLGAIQGRIQGQSRESTRCAPEADHLAPFRTLLQSLAKVNLNTNAMVGPPTPLPLPNVRNQDEFEIGIDAIGDAFVGLDPVPLNITGIRFLRTKAAVDGDLLDAGRPKKP